MVLAATDPGPAVRRRAALARLGRSAVAQRRRLRRVWSRGEPAALLERGAKSLSTFPAAADHPHWAEGLASLVKDGRLRKIEIARIDGAPARESPVADQLRAAGFVDGYKGLTLRN